ncbi:tautomerase family protein [Halomonas sp. QX-2]|jgi:4-oxalocrotonate tautomerase|uniref:Tautomerase family protein n=1 Tax=Vreelandella sedimenti TaxID=2729618 RepID=A0A7Z0N7S2_9GAMM|nr:MULTISPECIES: tautomerase family protein [Halomonas]NYT73032.1 tautomerase family protein [Halomonas sedimenti]
MPIVTVQQSPGRTKEQRELLVKRITEAFSEAYGTSPEAVTIFLNESSSDRFSQRGGYSA